MRNKNILITGTTGGIGHALAQQLCDEGYVIYAPVRNLSKAQVMFSGVRDIILAACDLEDGMAVRNYLADLRKEGVALDAVFLAAGDFRWDGSFPDEAQAIEALTLINCATKRNFTDGLQEVYRDALKAMTLVLLSSQAANFAENDPKRAGEEGYVRSMRCVSALGETLAAKNVFREVVVDEPGLIDTTLARKNFTRETIGEDPDWASVPTPEDYAKGLILRAGV